MTIKQNRTKLLYAEHIIITLTVCFVFLLFLCGCGRAAKSEGDTINTKVGIILPLTGPISFIGNTIKNGYELAASDLLKRDINFDLLIEDNKGKASLAVNIFQKQVNVDKVRYFTAIPTGVNLALRPLVNIEDVLLFSLSFYPPIAQGSDNIIRYYYSIQEEARVLVEYIKENISENEKLAIIYSTDEGTNLEVHEYILPFLVNNNIMEIPFDVGQKDIRNEVLKAHAYGAEYICVLGFGSDFPNIVNTIKEISTVPPAIFGGIGFLEVYENYSDKCDISNIIFTGPEFIGKPTDKFLDFYNQYYLTFGQKPTYDAAYAYDNLYLLGLIMKDLVSNGSTISNSDIIDKIKNSEYEGITGVTIFDENCDAHGIISLYYIDTEGNLEIF